MRWLRCAEALRSLRSRSRGELCLSLLRESCAAAGADDNDPARPPVNRDKRKDQVRVIDTSALNKSSPYFWTISAVYASTLLSMYE